MSNERAPRLFIVDDDPGVLEVVSRFGRSVGYQVLTFESPAQALSEIAVRPPDAALVDLRMPSIGGIPVLREIKRRAPHCEVILMTGFGTIETAMEAVKLGAADYLRKPLDFQRLTELLSGIRDEVLRNRKVAAIEGDLIKHLQFQGMIGRTPAMLELFRLIRRIAPHFTTALITGETGSGKELVARALHALGNRRERPFIPVNCSAIVETLFESELFGHTKGAFTGATDSRAGLFERANGGVIFLDEIGELPLAAQSKFLRVLEDGIVTRVGSSETHKVDVRLVAATNRVLEKEVQAGRFRADLYYRLHVVALQVPALRERRDDIPLLARGFIEEFRKQFGKTLSGLTPEAEQMLLAYDWPGNVRELRNVLERASMLAEGEFVDRKDLVLTSAMAPIEEASESSRAVRPIQEIERAEIVRALDETAGNKKEAARRLGISRRALYRRLEKFGLAPVNALAS
ncbi:MAG: sigma-54-dependent Fis family transcriptional regulator [Acidobacteriota bacterium]|nr:sigma-54-dependent Fis family transcriptional regulator [Acidobacteriota bacterium]